MGYIKEPKGVDLVVAPSILTEKDKNEISQIISKYKLTGILPNRFVKTKQSNQYKMNNPNQMLENLLT